VATHGLATKAWHNVAVVVNQEVDDDARSLLFDPPLSGPSVKGRFERYMTFARENRPEKDDDEAPKNEIPRGIEKSYALIQSIDAAKGKAKHQSIAGQMADKDGAAKIPTRKVPYSEIVAKSSRQQEQESVQSGYGSDSGSETLKNCSNLEGSADSFQRIFTEMSRQHEDLLKSQEENKKVRLAIEEQKLALEKRKLEIEVDKRKRMLDIEGR
jgi:hypothetical protein